MEPVEYIHELYELAIESLELYERGELRQDQNAAYEFREVVRHLIATFLESNPQRRNRGFRQIVAHLKNIIVDPLKYAVEEKGLNMMDEVVENYPRLKLLHNLPDQEKIEWVIKTSERHLNFGVELKNKDNLDEIKDCFDQLKEAYNISLKMEEAINEARQKLSVSTQLLLWLIAALLAIIGVLVTYILST